MMQASRTSLGMVAVLSASLVAAPEAQAGSTQTWDDVSTALVVGLAGAAAGLTFAKHDRQGGKQLLFSLGSTVLATEALKAAITEERPDGSGNDSFPSGHASVAFAAATYISIRYGHEYPWAVPVSFGAAALTGVARVEAYKHYAGDVIAGAAIGAALTYFFTTPANASIAVYPTRDGAGFAYTMHF
jgi:membrane-associated phospholipid phosphatase